MTRCFDWTAWYDRMPGADQDVLHVAGRCEVDSSSTQIRLEPYNEGIVDDPELFVVRVVVDETDWGDTMMDTKEVGGRWRELGIKRVEIRLLDGGREVVEVSETH